MNLNGQAAICDSVDRVPLADAGELSPSLVVMVLPDGPHRFALGEGSCEIRADDADGTGTVVMVNTMPPSRPHYLGGETSGATIVSIDVPHAWIRDLTRRCTSPDSTLKSLLSADRAWIDFPATRQMRDLAQQILDPPPSIEGVARELYRRSRALDILCQACVALREQRETRPRPQLASRRRSERVRDYVLDNLDKDLTIDAIAAAVGASVSSVQRDFKVHFRMSVFAFIRGERLARACAALERKGITIAEAAYAAGYADPANFTIAFKRLYGVSPKHRRR
jgi:AraC-like DNA-binding protein